MAAEALRGLRDSQAHEKALAGQRWQDTGLVFTTHRGTALDAGNVRKMFKRVCIAAEVGDGWTPRELRTSFVSLMSHRGVSIEEIAHLVGHAFHTHHRGRLPLGTAPGDHHRRRDHGRALPRKLDRSSRQARLLRQARKSPRIRTCQPAPRLNGTYTPGLTGDSHQGNAIGHYAM